MVHRLHANRRDQHRQAATTESSCLTTIRIPGYSNQHKLNQGVAGPPHALTTCRHSWLRSSVQGTTKAPRYGPKPDAE